MLLDASAVVDLLLHNALGRKVQRHIAQRELWSVAHVDAEVFSALSRLHRERKMDADDVGRRLELLTSLELERLAITHGLLARAWELRANITARDALYVAAARTLALPLITTDRRLLRAAADVAVDLGEDVADR